MSDEKRPLACQDIQRALLYKYYRIGGNICFGENLIPPGYTEMDALLISKAMFITEFEVKVSKWDLKADFKKVNKHHMMENRIASKKEGWREHKSPNYFYFCGPPKIFEGVDIPEYAGIIHFIDYKQPSYGGFRGYVNIIKRAKRLHTEKVAPEILNNLLIKLSSRAYERKMWPNG